VAGGGQRASGTGRADGGHVGPTGGRGPDGQPRFDQPVARGGYLWWYVDALSDDGRFGLTIIAFVGSVFSPYYAWAHTRGDGDPDDHCSLNVCLYGPGARRWTMTERGRSRVARDASSFTIGPSAVRWDGTRLTIDIDERAVPFGQRVRGRVTVTPDALCQWTTTLDDAGRHRWGPIAPSSRVEVTMQDPSLSWSGPGYLDSNEGDEPVDRPFVEWDWSRASLSDGSVAVVYDVRQKAGSDRVIAARFRPDGEVESFEPPPRQALPRTAWRIDRTMRTDPGVPARVVETLEDTPFYVRSVLESGLLGERVTSMHETLNVPRFVSTVVRLMLPWRMPRRG
jgi:carotenoid 1,2-hydratase